MAYPLVFLPLLLLTRATGEAWQAWVVRILVREVLLALLLGAALGYLAGWLLRMAVKKRTIEKPEFLAYSVALTLLALGGVRLIGSDGLLAVFVAGVVFKYWLTAAEKREAEQTVAVEEPFLTLPIFGLLGLVLPLPAWLDLGWPALLLVAAIILLRRLPALLLLSPWLRELQRPADAFFVGWFGPIGIGALFYATLTLEHGDLTLAWTVGSLLIASSMLIHGLTATPFSRWYCRYTGFVPPERGRKAAPAANPKRKS